MDEKFTCCSFCDKKDTEIYAIVYYKEKDLAICNECIDICNGIILMKRIEDTPLKIVGAIK